MMMKKLSIVFFVLVMLSVGATAKNSIHIPSLDELSTAKGCHDHDGDAVKCAKYYLKNMMDEPKIKEAANFFMEWIAQSDEIMMTIGEPAHTAITKCPPVLYAYMAACVVYNQNKKQKNLTFEMHEYAMMEMLKYYAKNKDLIGDTNGDIQSYVDAMKSGRLKQLLRKEYDETMDAINASKGQISL